MNKFTIDFADAITTIGKDAWNKLTGTDNPFMRYEFLAALEATDCTNEASGWQPHHVVVRTAQNKAQDEVQDGAQPGEIIAIIPLYEKTNSYGEYVFDWSWAHAYQQNGLNYYPKFVTSAPFTPSVGRRLFIADGYDASKVMQQVCDAVQEQAQHIQASSWHILFPTDEEHKLLTTLNLMPRSACQFHWHNRGYQSFEQFLASMNSRKRKNIRKERTRVQEEGITFQHIEGADIPATLWQEFYAFYQNTHLLRGRQGYLNQAFFHEVSRAMPEQLLMICARQNNRTIATALFFKSADTLFGRYWGSAQDYQFLHFETCFYQGQDYAIKHGYQHFDSGAQGEHKIQRGFEPTLTHSNHWIAHPAFRTAIQNFLGEEARHIKHYQQQAESLLPFKDG
ncbi:MAG: GNAT family N-acetyltransferase [Pseudohongiellaceae bacterium]